MDELLGSALTLRAFLQSAAADTGCRSPVELLQRIAALTDGDAVLALDHTFVRVCTSRLNAPRFPLRPWDIDTALPHAELIHHVIARLLNRRRANWEDGNLLALGYRDATPASVGHLVSQSNGVMCYYPNTLVALLKQPHWETLHMLMGDDLFMHLLLHYVILVELPGTQRSFVQVAGKSLRQSMHSSSISGRRNPKRSSRECVSLNEAMYARLDQDSSSFFRGTSVLGQVSRSGGAPISRGAASRVLKSIFPDAADQKRLPRRLVNLIPIVQTMAQRLGTCDIKKLSDDIVPVCPAFRKFMSDNGALKQLVAARTRRKPRLEPGELLSPVLAKAMDAGYLSQSDDQDGDESRKRKRREEAVEAASDPAMYGRTRSGDHARKKQKIGETEIPAVSSLEATTNLQKLQEHKQAIQQLLACTTSKRSVYRFIRKLVAIIIPKELWGSKEGKSNWKIIKKLLRKLVFARKFDLISVKKVSKVAWMNKSEATICPPNEITARRKLFAQLIEWMVTSLAFPVLRELFYITETEGMANDVVYYQRPVWNAISALALDDLDGGIIVPKESGFERPCPDRQLSSSRLRLLPKGTGVRPLMNLSATASPGQIPVNKSLEKTHQVLNFEISRRPKRLIGSAVRNVDEIYDRLQPLFKQVASCPKCQQRRNNSSSRVPLLYFVSVDIERCFDTIRARRLYGTLKKALVEEEYLIRKYWVGRQLYSSSKSDKQSVESSAPSLFFKMERPAFSSGDLHGFDKLASKARKRNAVFVDGVVYDYADRVSVLKILKEHLLSNTVQVNGDEFVQCRGIPQGSVLSTTLCNIYYGQFERRVLRKTLPEPSTLPLGASDSRCQHEALLRYTDDWLFVSTDLSRAQRFSNVMHRGNDEYGCYVNTSKSQVNFDCSVGEAGARAVPRFDDPEPNGLLSWCGVLIDPARLQVYVNYEKSSSLQVQSSIPLDETKSLQHFFVTKVISPFRQRWHALFFDPSFLDQDTIQVNLFQMLSLMAHRFALLVEMLPFVNQKMDFFHENYLLVLKKTARGIHRSLERSTDAAMARDSTGRNEEEAYKRLKNQVLVIGLHCFRVVVQARSQRRQTRSRSHVMSSEQWRSLLLLLQRDADHKGKKLCPKALGINLHQLTHDKRNSSILEQIQ